MRWWAVSSESEARSASRRRRERAQTERPGELAAVGVRFARRLGSTEVAVASTCGARWTASILAGVAVVATNSRHQITTSHAAGVLQLTSTPAALLQPGVVAPALMPTPADDGSDEHHTDGADGRSSAGTASAQRIGACWLRSCP